MKHLIPHTSSGHVHESSPWCGGQVVSDAGSSSLATYGVIYISFGHITAQLRILGIS